MDDYEKLQHKTRNLEQEYTKHLIRKFKNKTNILQKKCKTMAERHCLQLAQAEAIQSESIVKQIMDLEKDKKKLDEERKLFEVEKNSFDQLKSNNILSNKDSNKMEETLTEIKDKITVFSATLDQLSSIKKRQEETIRYIMDLKKSNSPGDTAEFYLKKISQLEDQIDKMKQKTQDLESSDKVVRELKDSINLLKSSVEAKDKTIEILKDQIQKLSKKNESQPKIETVKTGNLDPWALTIPSNTKPTDDNKKVSKSKKKPIDVESIFKEENKSFFNNLSFSNSSPVFDKKFKKGFK